MRRTSAVLVASLVLATVACGDDDDPVATGGDPTATMIQVSVGGGFSPVGTDFMSVPTIVLGDGTVFQGGAITEQFPGPAILPVVTGTMSEANLEHLLRVAKDAGLDDDSADYGTPGITDVGTTTITVLLDGEEHTTTVYALGYEPEGDAGISDAQRDARSRVAGFVSEVADQAGAVADEILEPTAYQVQASSTEPASSFTEEPRPNEVTWPFPDLALAQGTCLDLRDAQAATFAEALQQATGITVWTDTAGASWHLAVRATLPGDEPCSSP